jgi:antibiotic biosynthesis monooxygenase (ABM) superfamily enzyme
MRTPRSLKSAWNRRSSGALTRLRAASPGDAETRPSLANSQNLAEKGRSLVSSEMDEPIHIAITVRVRKAQVAEFERALTDFVSRSLAEPGARGVQCLYPPPGSASTEYGLVRSFASAADRDAFCWSAFFKDWLARIEPMVEGRSTCRELRGLEAWFRDEHMPPRWKIALLTWPAVWLASTLMRTIVAPALGPNIPQVVEAGFITAGVVIILTWVVMPFLVRIARPWLRHESPQRV